MVALNLWRDVFYPDAKPEVIADQLVRALILAGFHSLSAHVQAIKIYAKAIRL